MRTILIKIIFRRNINCELFKKEKFFFEYNQFQLILTVFSLSFNFFRKIFGGISERSSLNAECLFSGDNSQHFFSI